MRICIRLSAAMLLVGASLPAAADPAPAGGWIAYSRTGCRAWNPNPQPEETIAWSGGCENGVLQGNGVLQWYKEGKPTETDEGEFRDGKLNGHSVLTWADERFEGDYRDGKANGRGVEAWANGNRYEGEFRDDKRSGGGVYTWANGSRYEGEWRDNKQNGRGVFTEANGDRYEGEFRDDKPNGLGILTTASGSYDGAWHDGCFRDGDRRAAVGAGVELSGCP
jgi:hypothetical protein